LSTVLAALILIAFQIVFPWHRHPTLASTGKAQTPLNRSQSSPASQRKALASPLCGIPAV